MANFKGMIGLEQLSPEVLSFFQNLIDEAIKNSGGNPDPEKIIAHIKGVVATSVDTPTQKTDVWIKPTDGSITTPLVSSSIVLGEAEPVNPSPGDVFVKKEI